MEGYVLVEMPQKTTPPSVSTEALMGEIPKPKFCKECGWWEGESLVPFTESLRQFSEANK